MRISRSLALGASLLALVSVPAFAQDAQAQGEPAATEETDSGDIIVTATGRAQIAQDVPIALNVVGGEALVNAGVTDIRGIRQLTPSLQTTTGQSATTGVVIRIRGIGTAGDNPGFEPAVGVFIDGVLRARAGVALGDLPPIERVEVLRGPQGTLFGRNTSAGALNLLTQGPDSTLGGYAEASYGNYNEYNLRAGITGPLSDLISARLDGSYHKRDGYVRDVNSPRSFNNLDRWTVRGQALYENDDVSFRLIADYGHTDEQCCTALNTNSGFLIPVNPANINTVLGFVASSAVEGLSANPLTGGAVGRDGIVRPFSGEQRLTAASPNRDLSEGVKDWGISGELNWTLGDITLTSITAYRDWKARRGQDIDFSGLDRAYRDNYRTGLRDFTQEIRLKGSAFDGALDWLVGGFYLNERNTLTDGVRFGTQADQFSDSIINGVTRSALLPTGAQLFGTLGPGVPLFGQVALASSPALQAAAAMNPALFTLLNSPLPRTPNGAGQIADNYRVQTDAFALFTHNIIHVSDRLTLTLGLRYNHESKDISANLNAAVPACSFFLNPATAPYRQALGALFPLAHLYTCNPTVNSEFNGVYSGGRSENEFTGTAKVAFKVNDDLLIYGGYDRGYKSGGFNLDRASFDSVLLGGNGAQISDLTFGNETSDVYEIGFKSNFTRAFQLNATAFYTDLAGYQDNSFRGTRFVVSNYREVIIKGIEVESIIRPARNLNITLGYTYLDSETHDPLAGNDNGRPLTNSPRHVMTGAVTWTPQITPDVAGLVHVDWRANSDHSALHDPFGEPFITNDGYEIVNLRVGLNFADGRYGIEAFVENLFNKYYNVTAFPVPEQGLSFAVYPSPPRFYGVKVRASF